MEKKVLRLKLTDFLCKDVEEDVMYFLEQSSKELQFELRIYMWYIEKICNLNDISRFKEKYKSLIVPLNIQINYINGYEETVWYDIISKNESSLLKKFKFRSLYSDCNEIPGCIIEFSNFAKSYGYNRYGTRNNKNMYNWVSKMGKQTEDKRHFVRPQESVGK